MGAANNAFSLSRVRTFTSVASLLQSNGRSQDMRADLFWFLMYLEICIHFKLILPKMNTVIAYNRPMRRVAWIEIKAETGRPPHHPNGRRMTSLILKFDLIETLFCCVVHQQGSLNQGKVEFCNLLVKGWCYFLAILM